MSVELLQTLSNVFFVLAVVMLLIAIALFFILDVVHLVGDVTGSTARKAIENIRKGNEISGDKAYKPSAVNMARGKLTDKISPSGQLKQRTDSLTVAIGTEKLSTVELLPKDNETTILYSNSEDTTILSSSIDETTVLGENLNESITRRDDTNCLAFDLNLEMSFIGSGELIE